MAGNALKNHCQSEMRAIHSKRTWLPLPAGQAGKNGQIPKDAVKFANIGDYIVMRLTGRKTPLSDESIAAGFGGFDLEKKAFALEKLSAAGVDVSFYPELANAGQPAGFYNGIPTGCAWGDNQASFYGTVGENRDMISVNVGTGSQVSLFDSRLLQVKNAEVRQKGDAAA